MTDTAALLEDILATAASRFVFSGYAFHGEGPSGTVSLAGGSTAHWGEVRPVEVSTWFDIGSVTKAVATTSLFALAVDRGELSLDDNLATRLPETKGTAFGHLRLADLLSHSGGLVGWYPLYRETDRRGLLSWMLEHESHLFAARRGEKAVYSDPGFLLLGLVLERAGGGDLDGLFRTRVAGPLGLTEVAYGPVERAKSAATEYHLEKGRLLHGEVFDENASALGGRCPHAGLFATARGLGPWAREWLRAVRGESKWLGQGTAKLFTTRSHRAPGSTWAYGWDTRSVVGSSAGSLFSLSSFGHLGYPGCSVWIDPEGGFFAVFLSNRIHPSRLDERIREVRPRLHDAWAAAALRGKHG